MWRFEFKFALGAIIALLHDVFITLGIFSLLDIEISAPIIAAVLTIVGYSLNDTIVVFDRIRENLKVKQKDSSAFLSIVNKSLNETLSRTIITSVTTLIVVTILFFLGGEVLRSFAFALIVGILIGTYSSLFVASPIVVEWQLKKSSAK
jgi:preprotein translocase SecF subunit